MKLTIFLSLKDDKNMKGFSSSKISEHCTSTNVCRRATSRLKLLHLQCMRAMRATYQKIDWEHHHKGRQAPGPMEKPVSQEIRVHKIKLKE